MKVSCRYDALLPVPLAGYDASGFPEAGPQALTHGTTPIHPESAWYALFVRTGHEAAIRTLLHNLYPDLKTLVPTRELREYTRGEWRTVTRRLLPGYLFFHTLLTPEFCSRLRGFAHVIRVCGHGRTPAPIEPSEMGVLLQLVKAGDLIRFSRVYRTGERVVVESGPLKGLEGIIESCNPRKKRVRIRLHIDGDVKTLDLSTDFLDEPAAGAMERLENQGSADGLKPIPASPS